MSQQSQYPSTFYRVSLKAVIRDDQGRVLVNKEGSMDTWSLPGGGWDHGETEHEAIARELYEELGYRGTSLLNLGLRPLTGWNLDRRICCGLFMM